MSSFVTSLFSTPKGKDHKHAPDSVGNTGGGDRDRAGGDRPNRLPPDLQVITIDLSQNDAEDTLLMHNNDFSLGSRAGGSFGRADTLTSLAATTGGEGEEHQYTLLLRHDSEFSVGSDYESVKVNEAPPLLNYWQGAILLTADCLGTGLLALPGDVAVLGFFTGLTFLIVNAPINLYAGTLLAQSAQNVERRQAAANRVFGFALRGGLGSVPGVGQGGNTYGSMTGGGGGGGGYDPADTVKSMITIESTPGHVHSHLHHDTATFDFIGMTQAIFKNKTATRFVMALYYCNIFLVMGNYILVMSHAVIAMVGEGVICIPVAGLIAVTFMYAVSQSRTMARLGRAASILSLMALFVVICQCLYAAQMQQMALQQAGSDDDDAIDITNSNNEPSPNRQLQEVEDTAAAAVAVASSEWSSFYTRVHSVFRMLSALGSIGFAMGSQKLFLNIRHELSDRAQAPVTLGISLAIFTTVYTMIIILAGPNPPSFLFDAIPGGSLNRRIAGFLLWGHVVVSYAINSQAICSSMDRLFWHRLSSMPGNANPAIRWMILTALMAVASYTVANAIPFFTDLVGLIGAMTAVPLTLLLPAIFWRKQIQVPIWKPTWDSVGSYLLLAYSVIFMVTATCGALDSISQDWKNHGSRPFACVK